MILDYQRTLRYHHFFRILMPASHVAPIHDRQMVVLERSDSSAWLEQTGHEADLLRALPVGSLNVEQVR
jgi:putative SOS response-associated peptidase YedK